MKRPIDSHWKSGSSMLSRGNYQSPCDSVYTMARKSHILQQEHAISHIGRVVWDFLTQQYVGVFTDLSPSRISGVKRLRRLPNPPVELVDVDQSLTHHCQPCVM